MSSGVWPKWPFLLMYGSHNMRHTGIPRVDGLSTDPRNLGRQKTALTAVYTINQCPSSIVQNQTPYDLLFGSSSSYDLLRVFRCVCFVPLHYHERNKLQSHSRLCCFLGYGIGQKGYRCYDPISKRLRVSRHVVFWEHKMFYQLPHVSISLIPSIDHLPNLFP